jgi:2-polyprenyl-3-methyl-5-hydroxy-6-metoxy-1,4-benzoquinol methylase
MKSLPISEVYEKELAYMPYKESLKEVADVICSRAPKGGSLLDLMCGPGYLLGKIAERRRDLVLRGIDLDKGYIEYARRRYSGVNFHVGDVLTRTGGSTFDVAICTGALHHLPYERQEEFIKRFSTFIKWEGFGLISDCYIDNYGSEEERKLAAAKLGYEYLKETIRNGAPDEVVAATVDILHNDVMKNEFKTSLIKRMPIFKRVFNKVELFKTWPDKESQYGDYYVILER